MGTLSGTVLCGCGGRFRWSRPLARATFEALRHGRSETLVRCPKCGQQRGARNPGGADDGVRRTKFASWSWRPTVLERVMAAVCRRPRRADATKASR